MEICGDINFMSLYDSTDKVNILSSNLTLGYLLKETKISIKSYVLHNVVCNIIYNNNNMEATKVSVD